MANGDSDQKRGAAPYISFQTFKTFLAPLKEHVIPDRVDKSLLRSFSGSVQPQLMACLKFLRLIDDDGRPKDGLTKLVSSYGTDEWAAELKTVLESAYPELFQIPLTTVSPSQFNEAFKGAYPCEGETLSKGTRFFLSAGQEAKVALSPFLLKNSKPRSGPTARRRTRSNGKSEQRDDNGGAGVDNPVKEPQAPTTEDPWLSKYPTFDPTWTDDIKKSWFAGYTELMGLRKKAK